MKCNDSLVTVFDLRLEALPKASKGKFKLFRDQIVRRNPGLVTGIVLHQTAIEYGATRQAILKADGDKRLAIARRAKGIACHACAFEGFYAKAYPLPWYIYQANALNKTTLGLEIEGRYPGLMDDPRTVRREDLKTLWKGEATEFSEERLKSAKAALLYLVKEGRSLGMPIQYLYAHRQAKRNRRSDPGEELWRKVAVEYGVEVLGLKTRPSYIIGTGTTIPSTWSTYGVGPY